MLRYGARRNVEGYTFYLGRRDAGGARLGMLISRRHGARAIDRNVIKRCIREAFRLEQEGLPSMDILVRPPYGIRASTRMVLQVRRMFAGLSQ